MTNPMLARDYFARSPKRMKAIDVRFREESWPDVVRERQEVVELLRRAVLRSFGLPAPFSHDRSEALAEHAARLPVEIQPLPARWRARCSPEWRTGSAELARGVERQSAKAQRLPRSRGITSLANSSMLARTRAGSTPGIAMAITRCVARVRRS